MLQLSDVVTQYPGNNLDRFTSAEGVAVFQYTPDNNVKNGELGWYYTSKESAIEYMQGSPVDTSTRILNREGDKAYSNQRYFFSDEMIGANTGERQVKASFTTDASGKITSSHVWVTTHSTNNKSSVLDVTVP